MSRSRKSGKLLVLFVLSLLAFWLPAEAGTLPSNAGVDVTFPEGEVVEVEPGSLVRFPILVRNRGQAERHFRDDLLLPPEWRTIIPGGFPFALLGEGNQLRLFGAQIPASAPPGNYELYYVIGDESSGVAVETLTLTVTVLSSPRLEMETASTPGAVLAGDGFDLVFRVANRGNSRLALEFVAQVAAASVVEIVPATLELDPGAEAEVGVALTTDRNLPRKQRMLLRLKAIGTEAGGREIRAEASGMAELIPLGAEGHDPYHRFPSQLRFHGNYTGAGEAGVQSELSGSGTLDEAGLYRMDYLVRRPLAGSGHGFFARDEYRLRLNGPGWGLQAGDDYYSLSRLTQNFAYGRGLGLSLRPDRWEMGGFHRQSRWGEPTVSESAGYVRHQVTDRVQIGANLLYREEDGEFTTRDSIYSVETRVRHHEGGELAIEYAIGDRSTADRAGAAVLAEASGRLGESVRYAAGGTYANPNYFGQYRDLQTTFGSLHFPVYGRLRGNLSYQQYRNNLDKDPIRSRRAMQEETGRAGVAYSFFQGTRVSLDLQQIDREDVLEPADVHYGETSVRLGIGHSFDLWSVQTYAEQGVIRDYLKNGEKRPAERYSLFGTFRPTALQSYSLFGRTGDASYSAEPSRGSEVGVSGRWLIGSSLTAHASYSVNKRETMDTEGSGHQAGLGAFYRLPVGHTVQVSTSWSQQAERDESVTAFATYTIPIEVPIRRKRGFGAVAGTIVSASLPGTPPLANVVVRANGVTAISDAAGNYRFPALKPGFYTLRVEQASIGAAATTIEILPLVLEVIEGETLKADFGIVPTSEIRGRVTIREPNNADARRPGGREQLYTDRISPAVLGRIPIQVQGQTETRHTFTDENGQFSVLQLRPGTWTVTTAGAELPPEYHLDSSTIVTTLLPGRTGEILFSMVPRQRSLRFIDEGVIE